MSEPAAGGPLSPRTVLVASSAGGLNALLRILPALPDSFAAPVICVQHMSPHQPSLLAQILGRRCALRVAVVEPGSLPVPGTVLLAPPDHHVIVKSDGRLDLWDGPQVNHVRPSADLLFSSAAEVIGERTVAVVLSGTGHDGAAGAAAVHVRGGLVLVQSPATCEFPGMVEAAMRLLQPDAVVALDGLAGALTGLVGEVAM